MSDTVLTPEMRQAIDVEVAKFPTERKRSASLSALRIVQEMGTGHVTTEQMDAIADYLDLPPIAVYEVATFYTMCKLSPTGKHNICVCTNLSCSLSGASKIVEHLKKRLNIDFGETTQDGKFALEEVECLGACVAPPVLQIRDRYYENLTPEKVDEILAELESQNGE